MSLFAYENLYQAWFDCRSNKRNRQDALLFETNAEENLKRLCVELRERTYHPSTSTCFVTNRPKLREIFAADYRDRIVHHLLVRYLEKIWEPIFIYDSYASRYGKGIHLAVNRLRGFMRKITGNGSVTAYAMQLDIKNFFMTIDKDILFDMIAAKCRHPEALYMAEVIIRHDPTEDYQRKSSLTMMQRVPRQKSLFGIGDDKGLPIGNLTSQFFANIYLNGLDQFVKHRLKCRYYGRYVDDFVLLHRNRRKLEEWKTKIEGYLRDRLLLSLNDSRFKIRDTRNGVDFLGYIVRPSYTLIRKRVVNNLKTKLDDFEKKLIVRRNGAIVINYDDEIMDSLHATLCSYMGHFKHGNSYCLTHRMFERRPWLSLFFLLLKNGQLKRMYEPPKSLSNIRKQYMHVCRYMRGYLVFFRVGCFYEFYSGQAERAMAVLKLKRIEKKHGFALRCGFGEKARNRYIKAAFEAGESVAVVEQTGYRLRHIAERKVRWGFVNPASAMGKRLDGP